MRVPAQPRVSSYLWAWTFVRGPPLWDMDPAAVANALATRRAKISKMVDSIVDDQMRSRGGNTSGASNKSAGQNIDGPGAPSTASIDTPGAPSIMTGRAARLGLGADPSKKKHYSAEKNTSTIRDRILGKRKRETEVRTNNNVSSDSEEESRGRSFR